MRNKQTTLKNSQNLIIFYTYWDETKEFSYKARAHKGPVRDNQEQMGFDLFLSKVITTWWWGCYICDPSICLLKCKFYSILPEPQFTVVSVIISICCKYNKT